MLGSPGRPITSLYVHVPFCAQKCSYCAFYSEASSAETVNRYVSALIREMEMLATELRPRTVFFGGGTPSLLNLRQWGEILSVMERLGLVGATEWTVECNPATVSLDKAKMLREHGVNRVSLGMQSLDKALLERLGRVHSREMAFRSFDILRKAGFDNLNIDLMFAIPGQTLVTWRETLVEAAAMGSEHLSSYEVIYEEDTPLFEQMKAGKFEVDEDLACAMYEELVESAAGAGLRQYEVANFARDQRRMESPAWSETGTAVPETLVEVDGEQNGEAPAYACKHNINYWRGGWFYGLGPSATSYVRGVRTKNLANTQLYCDRLEAGQRAVESGEELAPLARAGETAAFGLRMVSGWRFDQFHQATGYDLRRWDGEMSQLVRQGWGQRVAEGFCLTHEGLRFADAAAQLFLC